MIEPVTLNGTVNLEELVMILSWFNYAKYGKPKDIFTIMDEGNPTKLPWVSMKILDQIPEGYKVSFTFPEPWEALTEKNTKHYEMIHYVLGFRPLYEAEKEYYSKCLNCTHEVKIAKPGDNPEKCISCNAENTEIRVRRKKNIF